MEAGEKKQKQHRPSRSIKKLQKKNGGPQKRHNPKAFTFSGGVVSVQRNVQRTMDIKAKREKVEHIDKTPDIPPPYIVVIQGPPKCGKTTLIRSLVKHYTKHTLTEVKGPITVVTGKNRRLTFIECPNDIPAMLDLAKIADLALLMIDAKFG
ncbi:AARP2CN (NUC121) domain-containing protein [Cardiosporidium cionae]|uniref:AARP2CN (NUC121) domain-containing protein n=1 Tax=Cardiosporidium cionae TaxID=476202 RepID=A0ABQ7J4Y0_9APIC|nr:AARP2CN (NUC121) domain-containing protein [Cardiosporidium cionae]|eukprot:KAF8818515.1 AARP2CN (NUC121) domain-containing protein [Cardiosporidium cionae]